MEKAENKEDRINLATLELATYFGSYTDVPVAKIKQKVIILEDLLNALDNHPLDKESFDIIQEIFREVKQQEALTQSEVMMHSYDCLLDIVARALPENLAIKLKKEFKR